MDANGSSEGCQKRVCLRVHQKNANPHPDPLFTWFREDLPSAKTSFVGDLGMPELKKKLMKLQILHKSTKNEPFWTHLEAKDQNASNNGSQNDPFGAQWAWRLGGVFTFGP